MTLLVLVLLAAQAAGAAAKPDLSGQWVINAAESDFGLIPPPQCRGLKLTHREPELTSEETRPAGEPCGLTLRYTTDGKPITYTANDAKQTARMTWSGNILVIDRGSDDGIMMHIEATLSADGRKLTREFSVDSPQGSTSWTYVYDRVR
ncbi:MAG: hypothetical protein ACRD3G_12715 [Vicinamibacterales bacterium]